MWELNYLYSDILENIRVLEDELEATDTEGLAYEAITVYDGRKFGVYLSALSNESYLVQAADQVFEELTGEIIKH